MKVADLFAGVGGMSQGFIMADFKIVFAVEHDKEIAQSFKLNHTNTDMYDVDIETLDIDPMELAAAVACDRAADP